MTNISKLIEVMASLRHPKTGCPWDLEQDFSTIAPYTLEEAYEVADAIDRQDMTALKDELGDLLFQVVFHARMAQEGGHFDFGDVVDGIVDKMVRRHPHVFSDVDVSGAEQVTDNWEEIKAQEREAGVLDGVAQALPSLKRAEKLGKRASRVGFDWNDSQDVLAKVREEQKELEEAIDHETQERMGAELGDLLFSLAQLARHHGLDAEACLKAANGRFESRFGVIESAVDAADGGWDDFTADDLEALWEQAKRQLS